MRVRRQEQESPAPEPAVSTLVVPDALIAWGRDPERAVGWPRDWAREVEELAARGREQALSEAEGERLLSRLEALVGEAVLAGRSDLLVGIDVQTAEWLRLSCEFPFDGQRVSVGRDGTFSWSEVRVLSSAFESARANEIEGSPDPAKIARAAVRAKNLVSQVFPDATIFAVEPETDEAPCASCGAPLPSVRITTESDFVYCSPCWRSKIEADPTLPTPRNRRETRR